MLHTGTTSKTRTTTSARAKLVYIDIKTLMRLCTHTIRDIHVSVGFVPGWFQIGFWTVLFQGGSRRACPGWFQGVSSEEYEVAVHAWVASIFHASGSPSE